MLKAAVETNQDGLDLLVNYVRTKVSPLSLHRRGPRLERGLRLRYANCEENELAEASFPGFDVTPYPFL